MAFHGLFVGEGSRRAGHRSCSVSLNSVRIGLPDSMASSGSIKRHGQIKAKLRGLFLLMRGHILHRRCLSLRHCTFLLQATQGILSAPAMFFASLVHYTKVFKSCNSQLPSKTDPTTSHQGIGTTEFHDHRQSVGLSNVVTLHI